ncbi:hypothetical protein DERF_011334 [Dermatophagoides farinae]|uniref:Uncharacterized protein n=1 Tax=Dermatophagoides farinae TaxID=6954 RepID=A0A922HUR6_DERFA|nr:hypothetical protein DERF_011334 [Dermatophagoides farinae]
MIFFLAPVACWNNFQPRKLVQKKNKKKMIRLDHPYIIIITTSAYTIHDDCEGIFKLIADGV